MLLLILLITLQEDIDQSAHIDGFVAGGRLVWSEPGRTPVLGASPVTHVRRSS